MKLYTPTQTTVQGPEIIMSLTQGYSTASAEHKESSSATVASAQQGALAAYASDAASAPQPEAPHPCKGQASGTPCPGCRKALAFDFLSTSATAL